MVRNLRISGIWFINNVKLYCYLGDWENWKRFYYNELLKVI